VAAADYGADPAARAWILALKHGGRRDLARPLGALLADRLIQAREEEALELDDRTVVVSVPLHPTRRFVRGFDQARLVARAMALDLGLRWLSGLRRTRVTPPQGAPGSRSRTANVREAFALREGTPKRIAGRRVLLVDDVVTSGATANECTRCLHVGGALEVVVVCIARAGPRAAAREAG